MTSSTFKKFEEFVNEELDKFYEDLEVDSKKYKVPLDFDSKEIKYSNSNMMQIDEVKKKETPKRIKKIWTGTTNDKGLF